MATSHFELTNDGNVIVFHQHKMAYKFIDLHVKHMCNNAHEDDVTIEELANGSFEYTIMVGDCTAKFNVMYKPYDPTIATNEHLYFTEKYIIGSYSYGGITFYGSILEQVEYIEPPLTFK